MYKFSMLKIYQQTLKNPVKFSGIGLHSGKRSKITILPDQEDQGFTFKRVDLSKNNLIKANYKNVSSAKLCTTLQNEFGIKVSTVEHLLAALYVSEIDNAIIEIDNEEIPIMDGSAKDFIKKIDKVGIKQQSKARKYIKVTDKTELVDGDKKISIEPCDNSFEVEFQLKYKNKLINNQKNLINFQKDDLKEVCESRTFCLFEDIEKIKKIGLAKGGSLENALVVDEEKVLNKDGLRNENEFVNHKILDLAGDFLLSGYRVLGKVSCFQGGHQLTNSFLKKFLNSDMTHTNLEFEKVSISKNINSQQLSKLAVSA